MSFERSVFINCPFNTGYINDLLKPILYIITRNKFNPRLSLEVSDSGQLRLEKIITIIKNCKYSIHDLSIIKSTRANEYSRMNMPFELGIDYGLRNSGIAQLSQKKFLILTASKYDYMKAVSDISGLDIKVHSNKTKVLFECLYTWASDTLKIKNQDPPIKLYYDFIAFNTSLFEEKLLKFGSKKIAINYIEKLSLAEYISEIKERI